MESITRFIEEKLKLKENRDKSGVRRCETCKFLGYTTMDNGTIRIAEKALSALRTKSVRLPDEIEG